MLQKLSRYQIALNYHNKHTGNRACNMRLFEATGLGCALITDHKSDLHEYFEIDSEVIGYNGVEEAIEKLSFLNENPKFLERVAVTGQKKCIEEHTTEKQIENLIKFFEK
jgi:spore maturation protein CgeB